MHSDYWKKSNELSQGAKAVQSGERLQKVVVDFLLLGGYRPVRADHVTMLQASKNCFFPEPGCFSTKCSVPLVGQWNEGKNRCMEADIVVHTQHDEDVILSLKRQESNGSAEQKIFYEAVQLVETQRPSALIVFGPVAKRDSETGFRLDFINYLWDWVRWHSRDSIFLFRNLDKLNTWIQAKMPVAGRGRTPVSLFNEFCDLNP